MQQSQRSPRSNRGVEDQRLSIIAEDGDIHIPNSGKSHSAPPRSTHRPFARRWKDAPPRASSDLKPPEYSTVDDSRQRRDRLAEIREKPAVARRGGWKRLLFIVLLVALVLAVALGVGLGVGLSRKAKAENPGDGQGNSNSGNPDSSGDGFPVGKYAIEAFLERVNTSCTPNPSTFRCYPYSTYSSSQSLSAINFNWIISGSSSKYFISSSDNPFAITFANISLQLTDPGTLSERYTFTTSLDKIVIPSSPITTDNAQAECYYNGTVLSAALFTRKNATITISNDTTTTQEAWQSWPFAVEVNQTISGGPNVPACYETMNGALGKQITAGLSSQPSQAECGCYYGNVNP